MSTGAKTLHTLTPPAQIPHQSPSNVEPLSINNPSEENTSKTLLFEVTLSPGRLKLDPFTSPSRAKLEAGSALSAWRRTATYEWWFMKFYEGWLKILWVVIYNKVMKIIYIIVHITFFLSKLNAAPFDFLHFIFTCATVRTGCGFDPVTPPQDPPELGSVTLDAASPPSLKVPLSSVPNTNSAVSSVLRNSTVSKPTRA